MFFCKYCSLFINWSCISSTDTCVNVCCCCWRPCSRDDESRGCIFMILMYQWWCNYLVMFLYLLRSCLAVRVLSEKRTRLISRNFRPNLWVPSMINVSSSLVKLELRTRLANFGVKLKAPTEVASATDWSSRFRLRIDVVGSGVPVNSCFSMTSLNLSAISSYTWHY